METRTGQTTGITSPLPLTFEEIDDLIYSARLGDVDALRTDITSLSQKYSCSASDIIQSAIDMEDESQGGTGACLLHWPAANGNIETLNYLLSLLSTTPTQSPSQTTATAQTSQDSTTTAIPISPIINHRNNSGNTPLHWAALNTHLECVKALVHAGAGIAIKNDAGHDAVFLAERSGWTALPADDEKGEDGETEATTNGVEGEGEGRRPVSKGMQVAEWLLECEEGEGLERGAGMGGSEDGDGDAGRMDGLEGGN
ncbi:ankyrin repeat protein [Histoplasma capsulatum var. duboisii H88]|uniref:Ankyrin repeat protein n=1 Tax=Ajellomyces capsulatus (strain H88) TaxID=544711 RepID=F0UQA6_AJEC8|nr:ankyrin repeat protein [Histoplasma capsulatum var. duboisii H88]